MAAGCNATGVLLKNSAEKQPLTGDLLRGVRDTTTKGVRSPNERDTVDSSYAEASPGLM